MLSHLKIWVPVYQIKPIIEIGGGVESKIGVHVRSQTEQNLFGGYILEIIEHKDDQEKIAA